MKDKVEQRKYFSNHRTVQKLESTQSPQTSAKAMLFARWQHHIRCGSGFPYAHWKQCSKNLKVIQNPKFLPDHSQNWITGSFCHSRHSQKISKRSVHNFLSYLADTQTDRQTNKVWQKHNLLGGGNYLFTYWHIGQVWKHWRWIMRFAVTVAYRPRTRASWVGCRRGLTRGRGNVAYCTVVMTGVTGAVAVSSRADGSSPPHTACMSLSRFLC